MFQTEHGRAIAFISTTWTVQYRRIVSLNHPRATHKSVILCHISPLFDTGRGEKKVETAILDSLQLLPCNLSPCSVMYLGCWLCYCFTLFPDEAMAVTARMARQSKFPFSSVNSWPLFHRWYEQSIPTLNIQCADARSSRFCKRSIRKLMYWSIE